MKSKAVGERLYDSENDRHVDTKANTRLAYDLNKLKGFDLKQNNLLKSTCHQPLIKGSLKIHHTFGLRSFHTRPFRLLPFKVIFEDFILTHF